MFLKFDDFLNENYIFEAFDADKVEKNVAKNFKSIDGRPLDDGSVIFLKKPIRIESSEYTKEMAKNAKNYSASIMYMIGAHTNEYHPDQAIIVQISRVKGTARTYLYSADEWKKYGKGAPTGKEFKDDEVMNSKGSKIEAEYNKMAKLIAAHIKKYPRDGSAPK